MISAAAVCCFAPRPRSPPGANPYSAPAHAGREMAALAQFAFEATGSGQEQREGPEGNPPCFHRAWRQGVDPDGDLRLDAPTPADGAQDDAVGCLRPDAPDAADDV
jgi:hypothetical protein